MEKEIKIQVFGRNNSKKVWAEYIDPGIDSYLVTDDMAEIVFRSPFNQTKVVIATVEKEEVVEVPEEK